MNRYIISIVVSMHLVDKLVSNLLYQINIDVLYGEHHKVTEYSYSFMVRGNYHI